MKLNEYELKRLKKERMEEIDKWLDNEYGCSYTRLEELHDFVIEQDMKHQKEKDKEIERLVDELEEQERHIKEANFEIERLTELCNKYEEEHKTTFETWQKDIKENEQLHSIIKEVRELCSKQLTSNTNITGYSDEMCLKDILEILNKSGNE